MNLRNFFGTRAQFYKRKSADEGYLQEFSHLWVSSDELKALENSYKRRSEGYLHEFSRLLVGSDKLKALQNSYKRKRSEE